MPSRKPPWTTKDEIHIQIEALNLCRSALKTLCNSHWGDPGDKSNVAHEVSDRSLEMITSLQGFLNKNTAGFVEVAEYLEAAIDQAPRPTMGVMGPVE